MKLRRGVKIVFFSLCVVSVIAMTEKRRSEKVCQHILIHVDNRYENFFIGEQDVQVLMTDAGADNVIGKKYLEIDLKSLESRIETNKYVHRAEVYRDVKGNLLVYAEQNRPVARVMRRDAPDAYISDEGEILPVSDKYTARVMLVSGAYTGKLLKQKIKENEEGQHIFELIDFIHKDEFWKAQIAQMEIGANGNILLYPQVGKQLIEFGKAEKITEKFNKLALFYEQVLPRKGWNYYTRVNLKYQDQIVCD